MNWEPDCVTPQASYQIQASEQQVSTDQVIQLQGIK